MIYLSSEMETKEWLGLIKKRYDPDPKKDSDSKRIMKAWPPARLNLRCFGNPTDLGAVLPGPKNDSRIEILWKQGKLLLEWIML